MSRPNVIQVSCSLPSRPKQPQSAALTARDQSEGDGDHEDDHQQRAAGRRQPREQAEHEHDPEGKLRRTAARIRRDRKRLGEEAVLADLLRRRR